MGRQQRPQGKSSRRPNGRRAAERRGSDTASRRRPATDDHEHVPHTVQELAEIEAQERLGLRWQDRLADLITVFAGSMLFVWLHVVWFAFWIALNTPWSGLEFDGFPYGLLTMVVSLEAIFLSTFVLISQNRQAQLADKRARIDLQVNVIAEQEVTKVMQLVADIHDHLGLGDGRPDQELLSMEKPTSVRSLVRAVEKAEELLSEEATEDRPAAERDGDTEA